MIAVLKRNLMADADYHRYSLFQFTHEFSSHISVFMHGSDNADSIEFTSRDEKLRPKQRSPRSKFKLHL